MLFNLASNSCCLEGMNDQGVDVKGKSRKEDTIQYTTSEIKMSDFFPLLLIWQLLNRYTKYSVGLKIIRWAFWNNIGPQKWNEHKWIASFWVTIVSRLKHSQLKSKPVGVGSSFFCCDDLCRDHREQNAIDSHRVKTMYNLSVMRVRILSLVLWKPKYYLKNSQTFGDCWLENFVR